MAKAYVLSEEDVLRLRRMADAFDAMGGTFPPNSPGTQYQGGDDQLWTPEVYVARVPSGGIPALTEAPGASIEDHPGSAECDIYFLSRSGTTGTLLRYPSLRQRVWNLSGTAISGNSWALVARHKGGEWFAVPTAVGGSGLGDHGCGLFDASGQTITDNTFTTVTWDTEDWDTDAYHSTSTNPSRITIPSGQAGKYLVSTCIRWTNPGTASMQTDGVRFRVNSAIVNVSVFGPSQFDPTAGTNTPNRSLSGILSLSVGDFVEVQAFQDSTGGASQTLISGAGNGSRFWAQRLA